uniref:Elongation of very long chain fatty acids protein n=1 Tax=Trichobilharzia regenti TaxID=157069 RepID=A0AA85IS86_TRIRE|nr:unnamed protein product [Trichobilharzia regenti]
MDAYIEPFNNAFERSMDRADPRVSSLFLMGSIKGIIFVLIAYLLMIHYGLKYMKGRKPYSATRFVLLYDLLMVVSNAYIVYECIAVALNERYSFMCQKVDYSSNANALRLVRAIWLFHVSKVVECLDTFFFIIRGRTHLVTWLHVYHHCTMIPLTWAGVKWVAGGELFQPVAVNSSVHVIMYSYYALAALGPQWRKYLWWKRYLTLIQMFQFTYGMLYSCISLCIQCSFQKPVYGLNLFYEGSLFLLFYKYYRQSYHKPKGEKALKTADNNQSEENAKLD